MHCDILYLSKVKQTKDETMKKEITRKKWRKLYRLLRMVEQRSLKTEYRWYYDILFVDHIDFLDRFLDDSVNDRILTYKTWGF